MSTDHITSNAPRPVSSMQPAAGQGTPDLGEDDFLRLLTTQLQHQDPLNPMENTEFVTQLSQFTSLERLENMSRSLEALALSQSANTSAQMVSFIGKDVVTSSPEFFHAAGETTEVGFSVDQPVSEVTVTIRDADGKVVRTEQLGAFEAGDHEFAWDGLNSDGSPMGSGNYEVEVTALDEEGNPLTATIETSHHIVGVSYANGFPVLLFDDGTEASAGEVREIRNG